jgi:hypothetical protein
VLSTFLFLPFQLKNESSVPQCRVSLYCATSHKILLVSITVVGRYFSSLFPAREAFVRFSLYEDCATRLLPILEVCYLFVLTLKLKSSSLEIKIFFALSQKGILFLTKIERVFDRYQSSAESLFFPE